MRLCINCKHYYYDGVHRCRQPELSLDPVSGVIDTSRNTCSALRAPEGKCGPEARFFAGKNMDIPNMPDTTPPQAA